MTAFFEYIKDFVGQYLEFPSITLTDIAEIIILAFLVYEILVWMKNTKAWTLFQGIVLILVFLLICQIFNFSIILWLAERLFSAAIIAVVIIFQPELRKALEQLGQNKMFFNFLLSGSGNSVTEKYSDKTINELVSAAVSLGKAKTGALIVIENKILLDDYINTGIRLDAEITSQLLINIFEHNTPLHDGAVVMRGDRIVSATCYLPLTDNRGLSKDLGTRHRAAVGMSEATDSLTIVVSEETGHISVAQGGSLEENLDSNRLRTRLIDFQEKKVPTAEKHAKRKEKKRKNEAAGRKAGSKEAGGKTEKPHNE
ncbi:MAG: diadenylate cyclase CdaA [Lachnospiraceae bacterium]|nr:diadenylate cyclase CdaA [Lachnospiraceae bacterium]